MAYAGGNGVSYTGLVNGDTAASLGGILTYAAIAKAAINVGNYLITPSGLTSGNYIVSYSDGSLTIVAAPTRLQLQ